MYRDETKKKDCSHHQSLIENKIMISENSIFESEIHTTIHNQTHNTAKN